MRFLRRDLGKTIPLLPGMWEPGQVEIEERPMKKIQEEQQRLEQLEEAARSLGIEVRYEPFKGETSLSPGGLCRLKGNYLLIVNNRATLSERISAIASAVNRFDLSGTYLRPGLREFLESAPESKEGPPAFDGFDGSDSH
jgi:hypothetical protein